MKETTEPSMNTFLAVIYKQVLLSVQPSLCIYINVVYIFHCYNGIWVRYQQILFHITNLVNLPILFIYIKILVLFVREVDWNN